VLTVLSTQAIPESPFDLHICTQHGFQYNNKMFVLMLLYELDDIISESSQYQ